MYATFLRTVNRSKLSLTNVSQFSSSSSSLRNKYRDYKAENEPILDYKKGSTERKNLSDKLAQIMKQESNGKDALFDVPIVIGDKEIRNESVRYQSVPFQHSLKLAKFYHADKSLINKAIDNGLNARAAWESTSLEFRSQVFLKAADAIANEKRSDVLASTMLGQAKTCYQAEIDSIAELVDFLRFNVQAVNDAARYKPSDVGDHTTNNMELRGMEGFVASIAPFNFTAIAGNLAVTPAIMGNVVLFKPSDSAVFSSYTVYKILRESGLPAGVINFLPADGPVFGQTITDSPHLAGVNFTGSVPTFQWLWSKIGQNLDNYITFPKISGECGGKNFHLIHPNVDLESAVVATIKSAFEFNGQKCSACSRLYVPESKWPQFRDRLVELMKDLTIDSALKFDSFSSAVIDRAAFDRITKYIEIGKKDLKLLSGGTYDGKVGYFVTPTLFETKDPKHQLMREEIFGPVLTAYVYKDSDYEKTMDLIDTTTPYALTGSIFSSDEKVITESMKRLRQSCGNMYINDKSTGAVVNQQPFGGARKSGTNDKPGGPFNVLKWTSPLSIKRHFNQQPASSIKHPSML